MYPNLSLSCFSRCHFHSKASSVPNDPYSQHSIQETDPLEPFRTSQKPESQNGKKLPIQRQFDIDLNKPALKVSHVFCEILKDLDWCGSARLDFLLWMLCGRQVV